MSNAYARSKELGRWLGPWGFPLIYLGWAYLFWSPIFASGVSVWSFPNVLFFLIGGASPLLAGITLAGLEGGRQRLRELGWRLIDVRRISLRWLAVILLFWPAFDLLMAGGALVLGVTDRPLEFRGRNTKLGFDSVLCPRNPQAVGAARGEERTTA